MRIKQLIILLFFLTCSNNYHKDLGDHKSDSFNQPYLNQPDGIYKNYVAHKLTNCDSAIQLAERDFKDEKYYIVEVGFPEENKFKDFFGKYLKEKYKIEILQAGCIAQEGTQCYSHKMRELLLKRGIDIYGQIRHDAAIQYRKELPITRQIKQNF